jgi:chromosome segregation ATPase
MTSRLGPGPLALPQGAEDYLRATDKERVIVQEVWHRLAAEEASLDEALSTAEREHAALVEHAAAAKTRVQEIEDEIVAVLATTDVVERQVASLRARADDLRRATSELVDDVARCRADMLEAGSGLEATRHSVLRLGYRLRHRRTTSPAGRP